VRRRFTALLVGVLIAALLCLPGSGVLAAGMKNASPYWFEDSYRTTSYVDLPSTSAIVNTAGTGTVHLPALSPDNLAFAPPSVHADVLEVGTASGVQGWGWNGTTPVRETFLDVSVTDPRGVAFLPPASQLGVRLAVATSTAVTVYGWTGQQWAQAVSISATGTVGIAAGANGGVLAATADGFVLYGPTGVQQSQITGLSGIVGISSAGGGGIVAVWSAAVASFYGWDGSSYQPLPWWSESTPSGGTLLSVALFHGGTGYWLVTPTQAVAYGWSGTLGMAPLSQWDIASGGLPATAVAASPGWGVGSLAVLHGSGIDYYDAQGGATLTQNSAISIVGQSWSVFAPSAVLQSTLLPGLTHNVDEVKMVDSMSALPSGTALAYQVSTDDGTSWTDVPPMTPTDVPSGDELVYRAVLSTTDQAETPVLDSTNVYEIATVVTYETRAVSWLLP